MGDGDYLNKDFNYLQLLYYQFRYIIFSLLSFTFESVSLIVFINVSPCQQNPSFACSILVYSRKIMLESSKIFVEHAWYVAKIFEPRPNSPAFATAGSAMTSGLTLNGCSFSKK